MIGLLFLAVQVAAVPPPIPQRVADCAAPTYASDQLVCGDEGLLALDRQLATLLAAGPASAEVAIEPQDDWFRRSRMCARRADHKLCLAAAYGERIAILEALARPETATPKWKAAKCGGKPARVARLSDTVFVVNAAGRTSAVSIAVEDGVWAPYRAIAPRGVRFRIEGGDTPAMLCKASPGWDG